MYGEGGRGFVREGIGYVCTLFVVYLSDVL